MHLHDLKFLIALLVFIASVTHTYSSFDTTSYYLNEVADFDDIVELDSEKDKINFEEQLGKNPDFEAPEEQEPDPLKIHLEPSTRVKTDVRGVQNKLSNCPYLEQSTYHSADHTSLGQPEGKLDLFESPLIYEVQDVIPEQGYFLVKQKKSEDHPENINHGKSMQAGRNGLAGGDQNRHYDMNNNRGRGPSMRKPDKFCNQLFNMFERIPQMVKQLEDSTDPQIQDKSWKSVKCIIREQHPEMKNTDILDRPGSKNCYQKFLRRKKRHSTYINFRNRKKKFNNNLAKRNVPYDSRFKNIIDFIIRNKSFRNNYTYVPVVFATVKGIDLKQLDMTEISASADESTTGSSILPNSIPPTSILPTPTSVNESSTNSSTLSSLPVITTVGVESSIPVSRKPDTTLLHENSTKESNTTGSSLQPILTVAKNLTEELSFRMPKLRQTFRDIMDMMREESVAKRLKKDVSFPTGNTIAPESNSIGSPTASIPSNKSDNQITLVMNPVMNSESASSPNQISGTTSVNLQSPESSSNATIQATSGNLTGITEGITSPNLPIQTTPVNLSVNSESGNSTNVSTKTTPGNAFVENLVMSSSNSNTSNPGTTTGSIIPSNSITDHVPFPSGSHFNITMNSDINSADRREELLFNLPYHIQDIKSNLSNSPISSTEVPTDVTTRLSMEGNVIPGVLIYPLNTETLNNKSKRGTEEFEEYPGDNKIGINSHFTIEEPNLSVNKKYIDFNPLPKLKKEASNDCQNETEEMLNVLKSLNMKVPDEIDKINEKYSSDSSTSTSDIQTSLSGMTNVTEMSTEKTNYMELYSLSDVNISILMDDNQNNLMMPVAINNKIKSFNSSNEDTTFDVDALCATSFTKSNESITTTNSSASTSISTLSTLISVVDASSTTSTTIVTETSTTSSESSVTHSTPIVTEILGEEVDKPSLKQRKAAEKLKKLETDLKLVNEVQNILNGMTGIKHEMKKRESPYQADCTTESDPIFELNFKVVSGSPESIKEKKINELGKILELKAKNAKCRRRRLSKARRRKEKMKERKRHRKIKHKPQHTHRFLGQRFQNCM